MMGGWTGIWQWVVVLAIVLLLFGGRGKISSLMGDFGKGLKAFKKSVKDEPSGEKAEIAPDEDAKALKSEPAAAADTSAEKDQVANG